jgi:hypothetical protein
LDINWDPVWAHGTDGARARERAAWLKSVLPFVSFAHGRLVAPLDVVIASMILQEQDLRAFMEAGRAWKKGGTRR